MNTTPATSFIERFAATVLSLVLQIGARFKKNPATLPAVQMAQQRVQGLAKRLLKLVARIAAGDVPVARPSRAGRERRVDDTATPSTGKAKRAGFPSRHGWVAKDDGDDNWKVLGYVSQIGSLLNEPATLELLAQAPGPAGRIVRPLCGALWLAVPEMFRLPPRPKRARKPRARVDKHPKRVLPMHLRRVPSAKWPRGCVDPGEVVSLRKRNRSRVRRNE